MAVLVAMVGSSPGVLSWIHVLAAILAAISGITVGWKALARGARLSLPPIDETIPPPAEYSETWAQLCDRADNVIGGIIAMLPDDVKDEARKVPYLFEDVHRRNVRAIAPWGFTKISFPAGKSNHNGPIFLYLRTIEDVCGKSGEDFDGKIASTYLHELGHHFGWDEVDLVRHGLPSGRPPGR